MGHLVTVCYKKIPSTRDAIVHFTSMRIRSDYFAYKGSISMCTLKEKCLFIFCIVCFLHFFWNFTFFFFSFFFISLYRPTGAVIYCKFCNFVDRLPLSVIITECGKLGMVTQSDIVLLLRRMDHFHRILTFIHWSTEFVGNDGHSKVLSNIFFGLTKGVSCFVIVAPSKFAQLVLCNP